MTARRIVVTGRVHGVGFRDWLVAEARRLGANGWVRNLRDGSVEALIDGDEAAVEELLRACRSGPPLAVIEAITEHLAEPAERPGFVRMPTA